ncbi:MAG: NTP transferase domain-containing protein, partial [Myxococcales bacterium]|nr:NTP transferase domain-containing protein [Myxococcales bacterium]
MTARTCLSIILAAGEGTRMKSARPKVLHEIAGLPMIGHVVRAAVTAQQGAADPQIAVVVGRDAAGTIEAVTPWCAGAETFEQHERLGTAHAVLAARAAIERGFDDILILFGDTPL